MSDSVVYFTDRLPSDTDPFSYWAWEAFRERAAAGSEVYIYLTGADESELPEDLHHRIHLRSALKKNHLLNWGPFIQSLLETQASSIIWVEPKRARPQMWPLALIPNLKQIGVLQAQITTLLFSSRAKKGVPFQLWMSASDLIISTHPQFRGPSVLNPAQRVERLSIDPHLFPETDHWSLRNLDHLGVVPGSLADLKEPKRFLNLALEMITRDPDQKFIFLDGFGKAAPELKTTFLKHPQASHFLFPEGLSAAQKGYALFNSQFLLTNEVDPHTSLAGLALKITLDQRQPSLEEKRVYGLL